MQEVLQDWIALGQAYDVRLHLYQYMLMREKAAAGLINHSVKQLMVLILIVLVHQWTCLPVSPAFPLLLSPSLSPLLSPSPFFIFLSHRLVGPPAAHFAPTTPLSNVHTFGWPSPPAMWSRGPRRANYVASLLNLDLNRVTDQPLRFEFSLAGSQQPDVHTIVQRCRDAMVHIRYNYTVHIRHNYIDHI